MKIPLIVWYYRMLGITFGGLSVGTNGEFKTITSLKIFGYICATFVTIFTISLTIIFINLDDIKNIRATESKLIYSFILMNFIFYKIVIITNLWFLQHKGFKLMIVIEKYKPVSSYSRYGIVFNIVWFFHFFIPGVIFIYETILIHNKSIEVIINFITKFYFCPILWITSMLTWFISIQIKDYLVFINK